MEINENLKSALMDVLCKYEFNLYFCKKLKSYEYFKFIIQDNHTLSEIIASIIEDISSREFKKYEESNDFNSICVLNHSDTLLSDKIKPFLTPYIQHSDSDLNMQPNRFAYYAFMADEYDKIQLIRFASPYHTLKKRWLFNRDAENNTILRRFDNYFAIDSKIDLIIWNDLVFLLTGKAETALSIGKKITELRDDLYNKLENLGFISNFNTFRKSTVRNSRSVLSYNPIIIDLMKNNYAQFKEDAEAAGLKFIDDKVQTDTKEQSVNLLHYICNKRIGRPKLNQIIDCDNPRVL